MFSIKIRNVQSTFFTEKLLYTLNMLQSVLDDKSDPDWGDVYCQLSRRNLAHLLVRSNNRRMSIISSINKLLVAQCTLIQ